MSAAIARTPAQKVVARVSVVVIFRWNHTLGYCPSHPGTSRLLLNDVCLAGKRRKIPSTGVKGYNTSLETTRKTRPPS